MDWFSLAKNDWVIYGDVTRIDKFVQYNKITADQFKEITGQDYTS